MDETQVVRIYSLNDPNKLLSEYTKDMEGRRHGVSKTYDNDGKLMTTSKYHHGEELEYSYYIGENVSRTVIYGDDSISYSYDKDGNEQSKWSYNETVAELKKQFPDNPDVMAMCDTYKEKMDKIQKEANEKYKEIMNKIQKTE